MSFCDITGNVKLERGVFLGSHVTIHQGKTIGEHAVVGMGSVVLADIAPNSVVAGNPASEIK
jgi:acetyltransferase-like isoleucine patch superfamily enzyme